METFEKMYSLKEAAGPLGCSRDSVVRLIRGGHLRAVEFPRMGGRGKNVKRQIPESELQRFLERNRGVGR
jgi:excisionase family DNA binding protein